MTAITTDKHIQIIFAGFQRAGAPVAFPGASTLNEFLNKSVGRARHRGHQTFAVDPAYARMFASAAVEMWHRAVHSFIISAGLTSTSTLWASVAGYYSTHYAIRAYAHLVGRYVLYRFPVVTTLGISGGSFYCDIEPKTSGDREHKVYRRFVHASPLFKDDPFLGTEHDNDPKSDSGHRNKANYHDHIAGFTNFRALEQDEVIDRINRISDIQLNSLPIPDAGKYPDLEDVQVIAFHRIVRFRRFMDKLFGEENRFWKAHRQPSWCSHIIDFQFTEPQLAPAQPTQ